jgi:hypothetical protein
MAASRCGIRKFRTYRILGDDIVIGNDRVAEEYLRILDQLGNPPSEAKSHRTDRFFEFAKRLFTSTGQEFSPFPLAGLREVVGKYHLLYEFLNSQVRDRGFPYVSSYCDPGSLAELLRLCGVRGRLVHTYLRNMAGLAALPTGVNVDPVQAGESFFKLARLFRFTLSCNISLASAGVILSEHMRQTYSRILSNSAEKAQRQVETWLDRAGDTLPAAPSQELDDQSQLLGGVIWAIPPIATLTQRADVLMGEIDSDLRQEPPIE